MIISCPAPFERLEALCPNHRQPDDPEPYEPYENVTGGDDAAGFAKISE